MKTNRTVQSGGRITHLLKYLEFILFKSFIDETFLDHETY